MSDNEQRDDDAYGAINFGEFRTYMKNKKQKLEAQSRELQKGNENNNKIFQDTFIHVNGYTPIPLTELKRMIVEYGGNYVHYLKKKSVTHIVASNLTNSKMQEFRAYKVVKPEWITDSINAGRLLPWQSYRTIPVNAQQLSFKKNTNSALTSADPDFIKRFYENSRLHHLSTWKEELKEIVEKMDEKYKNVKNKVQQDGLRVIMHIDFDCFFASVGLRDRPWLKESPVAVTHSKGNNKDSSSDIASCNYIAREYKIRNGMSMGEALRLCPDLKTIPYEFEKYRQVSEAFYEIMFQYADELQAVSVDEALVDVSSHVTLLDGGQEEALAREIQNKIKQETGCQVSIGISYNILLARMATRKAKPAGQFYCKSQDDIDIIFFNQAVDTLPGVGYSIRNKLNEMGITMISDIKRASLSELKVKLGSKMGQTLYDYARGVDTRSLETRKPRQSVSAEVNWGIRFESQENEKEFITNLSKEVSERLEKMGRKGRCITIKVMQRHKDAGQAAKHLGHGICDSTSKSTALDKATDAPDIIDRHCYSMLKSFHIPYVDIRGLGIQVTKLDYEETVPADQGKLNFAPVTINNQSMTESSTSRNSNEQSRHKPEMVVDKDAFLELPKTIQHEMQTEYTIVYSKEADDKQASSQESVIELPPWSQVDPLTLLELPKDYQEQILKSYTSKALTKSELSIKPKTKGKAPENLPYDLNVLNELPKDIRDQVIKEYEKKPEPKRPTIQVPTIQVKNNMLKTKPLEPNLHGYTDIQDIRSMLLQWLTTFKEPEPEDINTLIDYLIELVHFKDLEKVQQCIRYLLRNVEQSWTVWIEEMIVQVNEVVVSIYKCPLKF